LAVSFSFARKIAPFPGLLVATTFVFVKSMKTSNSVEFIRKVVCDENQESCQTLTCEECPNIGKIKEPLMGSRCVNNIANKEWVDDHVQHVLNQVKATPEEFIAKFTYQFKNLIKHAFIADEHSL
jgi:hypothetical protein